MNLKPFTKALMVTAIALSATASLSQSSSANSPEHPQPCNAGHQNTCIHRYPDVCNNDVDNCSTNKNNYCNDSNSNNCHQQINPTCQSSYPNNCNSQPPQVTPPVANTLTFSCSTESGVPTTFVTTQGRTYPIIRWASNYFSPHGYEPLTRCRQVSAKFQQFSNNGTLNYVTAGTVNHQPVICVSNTKNGACAGVLFTLKPEEDASRTIQQLFDIRSGAAGPLEESNSRIYFDMKKYLNNLIGSPGSSSGNGSQSTAAQRTYQ